MTERQESSNDLPTREADDLFDVAVDHELKDFNDARREGFTKKGPGGRRGGGGERGSAGGAPSAKRQRKDAKFGFGGKKRFSKSGDAMSAGDLSGFSARRMKGRPGAAGGRGGGGAGGRGGGGASRGKTARPGKNRRQAAAARR